MRWLRSCRPLARALLNWRQDTISKRLFLLLWVTLVLSHVMVVTFLLPEVGQMGQIGQMGQAGRAASAPAADAGGARDGHVPRPPHGVGDEVNRLMLPPFLPPHALGGGPPDHHHDEGRAPAPGGPDGPTRGAGPQGRPHGPPISPWLDYGMRVLVLGLGAWLGARWLTAPMRKLAAASHSLSRAITRRGELPLMDERHGPVEVRQTAEVFNNMARHLHEQFEQRSLMMAAVSHDLRTPLTRLRMRLERLQPDAEVARCVADVQDINAMIDAVLDAMNEERRHEPSALVDVLSLVQAMADDLQEAGHQVCAGGDQASVRVPPVGLRRVLDNLVGNALKYGFKADIRVQVLPASAASKGVRQVCITVDDAGPGIPPEQLEAVFKPFYKLDASRARASGDQGGTGLGLYITRELVERGGGHVHLNNRPEGGLRATLVYPMA
jgi:signal transduction histidine kinase